MAVLRVCMWCVALILSATASGLDTPKLLITTENWPPYNYLNDQNKIVGPAVDKVTKVLQTAGFDFTIELYPWARSYHLAKTRANTAIFSIMRSSQRENDFQWVCPLITQESLYFIKLAKREDIELKHIEDAKKYTTAASRDEFDALFLVEQGFSEHQHYELTKGDLTNFKLLLAGHADLIIANTETALINLERLNVDPTLLSMELSLNTHKTNPLCLAFSLSTSQSIVEKVRQALHKVDAQSAINLD